jgi:hypothetical protein
LQLFAEQVESAKALGFAYFLCSAFNGAGYNGYYTWFDYGYDADIPTPLVAGLSADLNRDFTGLRVRDVYDTPGGRDAWKKHAGQDWGDQIMAGFELEDGHRCMEVLDGQLRKRQLR